VINGESEGTGRDSDEVICARRDESEQNPEVDGMIKEKDAGGQARVQQMRSEFYAYM